MRHTVNQKLFRQANVVTTATAEWESDRIEGTQGEIIQKVGSVQEWHEEFLTRSSVQKGVVFSALTLAQLKSREWCVIGSCCAVESNSRADHLPPSPLTAPRPCPQRRDCGVETVCLIYIQASAYWSVAAACRPAGVSSSICAPPNAYRGRESWPPLLAPHTADPSPGRSVSKYFNKYWYMTSMVVVCTPVHTNRGPTPRNHPPMPSVW